MTKYAAVILAAGKGTRMNEGKESPIPKVMFPILGEPVIKYSVDLIKSAGIEKVVLVVGYKKELVENYFGGSVEYAVQEEQLGTGHAAAQAKSILENRAENVIVFYGDNPLFKPESIKKLLDLYQKSTYEVAASEVVIGMLTVEFQDPMFWAFGRIIRDESGNVSAIIEQKDCDAEQLKIKECNPGFYIFRADWFWENVSKIQSNNVQKEYYLTDMIDIATKQGKKIVTSALSEEDEARGINTPEQLKKAEEIIRNRD